MSAKCRFCGKRFESAQGVRAHLKSCKSYQQRPEKAGSVRQPARGSGSLRNGSVGSESDEAPDGFDLPLRQLQQRLASERVRLQLREVEDAHAELDRQAQAKTEERDRVAEQEAARARTAEKAREDARREAQESLLRTQRREAAERERQEKRRSNIQEVKRQVVDCWFEGFGMPSDLKPRIRIAIDDALARRPVDELPFRELVEQAQAIRDRIHREEKARAEQALRLATQRQRLIQHGIGYAQRELREVDGLGVWESWKIEQAIKADLESVAGTESPEDIEDRVENVFEDHGLGDEDEE